MDALTTPDDPRTLPRNPRRRRIAAAAGITLASLALVPLLWPVPPLSDVAPAREVAPDTGRFVAVDGLDVYIEESGPDDAACNIVLLHGFGASTFTWSAALRDLGARCRVVAFDRPGFGYTSRPLPGDEDNLSDQARSLDPYSPEYQAHLTIALMDELGMERAVLVGHSAGASVAVLAASLYPERISALILEAPALRASGHVPDWSRWLLRTPQGRHVGPLLVRRIARAESDDLLQTTYHDPSLVTDDVITGYRDPLRVTDWDRALWEYVSAADAGIDTELLGRLEQRTLVIQPLDDRIVDAKDQQFAVDSILNAELAAIDEAGHAAHEEVPSVFESLVFRFIDDLQEAGVP